MAVFKARARALDMLGRQQIAGIPTAITELFKNAHDAYADRVEVDLFRQNDLFLLRDDGLGMNRDDFENRWLTLGTESKLNASAGLLPPPIDPSKPQRPIMGEKGIGRLAIAVIGPQVLILTRAKRDDTIHDLVAAFIHWGMFEIPGIDLDQIQVPIRTFPTGMLPTDQDIQDMVDEVKTNLAELETYADRDLTKKISEDLARFRVDPRKFDGYLLGPSLSGDGSGTHFYILPVNDNLITDIEEENTENNREQDTTSSMRKTLLGFANTMTPGHPAPRIKTAFRDHKHAETYSDILEIEEFFSPEDFLNADHYIKGSFDEYGQFKGTISVYGEDYSNHIIPWSPAKGRRTECGPFDVEVGYIQGEPDASTLPPDDFYKIGRKLNKYGGLYIYRDNIRVLPYGDNDFDWIDIEKNRTKSASYYFFSYRRMFGAVNVTYERNSNLNEKAGREGFRENKAYRQFRAIMKNFFLQLAADFFRTSSKYGDAYFQKRSDLKRLEVAGEARIKQSRSAREAFEKTLSSAFQRIESGAAQREITQIMQDTTRALDAIPFQGDANNLSSQLATVEERAQQKIRTLRANYNVSQPIGYGLTPELRRQLSVYTRELERLDRELIRPSLSQVEQMVGEVAHQGSIALDRRNRITSSLSAVAGDSRRLIEADVRDVQNVLNQTTSKVSVLLRDLTQRYNDVVATAMNQLGTLDLAGLSEDSIVDERMVLEESILTCAEDVQRTLGFVQSQLKQIDWSEGNSAEEIQPLDVMASLEEELLALRERTDSDLELLQLGLAIEVINHEFNNTVEAIRTSLRRLKAWADVNERLKVLYQDLRTNFEHLDGYLTLFTPLHRRLYRNAVEFTGADILKYLQDLFGERLTKNNISIQTSSSFLKTKIIGYPSAFYPVFINLVENAIFWLQDASSSRVIRLDAHGDTLIISDSGPGIPLRDQDAIFEPGFTRKPGGRGLGLFISRDVLAKSGYQLLLDQPESGKGATFRIQPVDNTSKQESGRK